MKGTTINKNLQLKQFASWMLPIKLMSALFLLQEVASVSAFEKVIFLP